MRWETVAEQVVDRGQPRPGAAPEINYAVATGSVDGHDRKCGERHTLYKTYSSQRRMRDLRSIATHVGAGPGRAPAQIQGHTSGRDR